MISLLLKQSILQTLLYADLFSWPLTEKEVFAKIQNSKFKIQNDNKKLKIDNCQKLGIKEEYISLVKEGMREACNIGGTGWPFFKFKIKNSKLKIDNKNFFPDDEASGSAEMIRLPVAKEILKWYFEHKK